MKNRVAVVRGTFLRPGVSKNKRLYTKEAIAKAVSHMQDELSSPDGLPLTMATSHGAAYQDDASSFVGRVTKVNLNSDGSASFEADIANTAQGRDVAVLISGDTPFLKSISIRGEWLGDVETVEHNGEKVTTSKDFRISGIDFTSRPGVAGAQIENVEMLAESAGTGNTILESFDDFEIGWTRKILDSQKDKTKEAVNMDKIADLLSEMLAEVEEADTTPYGEVRYADPGYQKDGVKRYPIDSKAHCRAAWSYINQQGNANKYTAAQLARIKSRIKSAAKKFGINIVSEHEMLTSEIQDILEAYASIALVNDDDSISITGYATDPHQLKVVANRIAFGAIAAMHAIDPDDDGDIYLSKPDWSAVDATGDAGGMGPEDEEKPVIYQPDDNNMEASPVSDYKDPGVATDSKVNTDQEKLYCPSCNQQLPNGVTNECTECGESLSMCADCGCMQSAGASECTECGAAMMTNESDDSMNNKEALVADTEIVAEEVTESAPEVPRLLTDADLKALAVITAEAVSAVMNAKEVKEEEPTEEPEVEVAADAETDAEEPEAEVANENPEEGEMYSADDLKKAVAEALDTFKSEVAEAYRENGAPRKGLVVAEATDEDIDEAFSAERLSKMGTREFREAQYEAWSNVPFFASKFNAANGMGF